jgi:hypothetical protein
MFLLREAHALFVRLGLDGLVVALDLKLIPHEPQVLWIVFDKENELICRKDVL